MNARLALFGFLVAGCQYTVDTNGTACSTDSECVSGYVCTFGHCALRGTATGGGTATGSGTAATGGGTAATGGGTAATGGGTAATGGGTATGGGAAATGGGTAGTGGGTAATGGGTTATGGGTAATGGGTSATGGGTSATGGGTAATGGGTATGGGFGTKEQIVAYLQTRTFTMEGADIPPFPHGFSADVYYGAATQCYHHLRRTFGASSVANEAILGRLNSPDGGTLPIGGLGSCDITWFGAPSSYQSTAFTVGSVQGNGDCFDLTLSSPTFDEEGRAKLSPDGKRLTLELYFSSSKVTGHRCADGPVGAATVSLNGVAFTGNAQQVHRASPFEPPAGYVPVSFAIDDRPNRVHTPGSLEWKGSFNYEPTTRTVTKDSSWLGPYPPLHDDGPWNAGGHEPIGADAGDNIWGITVFVQPPASGSISFEYGLSDRTYNDSWLWQGNNGAFVVLAGPVVPLTAAGQALPPFGTRDLKLVLNKNSLSPLTTSDGGVIQLPDGGLFTWDTSRVAVKGSAMAWLEQLGYDDGTHGDAVPNDGQYTFLLSQVVGAGKPLPHSGLLNANTTAEFVWVLGASRLEYKNSLNVSYTGGLSAFSTADAGGFNVLPIGLSAGNNTVVIVP